MDKKNILMVVGIGILASSLLKKNKKKKYTSEELAKISNYKKYLEDNDYVILEKKKFKKMSNKGIKLSNIPNYYLLTKSIVRYLV